MTYLEYAKIVCPEKVHDTGFVAGCPETHGLPRCDCGGVGDCAGCYAKHEIPDEDALELIVNYASNIPEWVPREYAELTAEIEPASGDEIERMLEGLYG